ncbi:hypothetical protein [Luteimonas aestuarii]|uniref:hypothetical protein n=1 Tax=Luteimonas aestuarii TaxID=453837 RepID=UPI001A9D19D4|nr:hypothetical protein [Luteimonas aestuarii]
MSALNPKERFARELHAAVQANNPFLLRHLVRRIHQARIDAWRSAEENRGFPSLDAPLSPQGITAFHLACMGWKAYRDSPHLAYGFNQMALILAAAGADPFAEYWIGNQRRTIFEELEGDVPPALKDWMAEQPFDLHVSPSETMITQRTLPPIKCGVRSPQQCAMFKEKSPAP